MCVQLFTHSLFGFFFYAESVFKIKFKVGNHCNANPPDQSLQSPRPALGGAERRGDGTAVVAGLRYLQVKHWLRSPGNFPLLSKPLIVWLCVWVHLRGIKIKKKLKNENSGHVKLAIQIGTTLKSQLRTARCQRGIWSSVDEVTLEAKAPLLPSLHSISLNTFSYHWRFLVHACKILFFHSSKKHTCPPHNAQWLITI